MTTFGYVKIIKDCFAYKVDYYNNVIGVIRLFENEIFPKTGVYNYYRKEGDYWNTTQPEISVSDLGRFEVNPNCYIYTNEKSNYYEYFDNRYIDITGDPFNEMNTVKLIDFVIKLEINPISIKLI
jgi:hypothetical protein